MIRKSNRNIVDIVVDIMEGPRPMKNLKAAEKNRNCVDQFWDAYQAEYEARGKVSRDAVERVNQHNMAYPRLGDELDKRKSLSKGVTNLQRNDVAKRSACAACTKLRQSSQIKKKYLKTKFKERKMKNKTRSRDIKTRVRKNRYIHHKRIKSRLPKTISVNRITKCHCCYVRVKNKRVGNEMSTILNLEPKNSNKSDVIPNERLSSSSRTADCQPKEQMDSSEKTKDILLNEQMDNSRNDQERSAHSSIKTLKNPDTSVASLSSYNSYASLDHEPMVNMDL